MPVCGEGARGGTGGGRPCVGGSWGSCLLPPAQAGPGIILTQLLCCRQTALLGKSLSALADPLAAALRLAAADASAGRALDQQQHQQQEAAQAALQQLSATYCFPLAIVDFANARVVVPGDRLQFCQSVRLLLVAGPPALEYVEALAASGGSSGGGGGGGGDEPAAKEVRGRLGESPAEMIEAQMTAARPIFSMSDAATLDVCAPAGDLLPWMAALLSVKEQAAAGRQGRGAWCVACACLGRSLLCSFGVGGGGEAKVQNTAVCMRPAWPRIWGLIKALPACPCGPPPPCPCTALPMQAPRR